MRKKISSLGISFADSEYKSFHMSENSILTVHMCSWREEPFRIVFSKVIQFSYKLGDVPKGLYELLDDSFFLKEALSRDYIDVPVEHPYKLFQLEDIDDFPFIQVVAESVNLFEDNRS